jgi:hypothetical protein
MSYDNDHRVRAGRRTKRLEVQGNQLVGWVTSDDEDEVLVEFPLKYEACPTCQGRGKHTNPSIDSHGLSAEDFAEDPDFLQDYFSGVYDVACYECGGRTTVAVVDEARANPEQLALWHAQEQWDREYEAECAAERRFGY